MDHFGLIPHIRQVKHHDFARNWLHPTSQPLNFAQGTDLPEKTGAQGSIVLPTVCTGDGPEKMAILTWIHGGFPGPIPAFRDFRSGFLRIWAVLNCPIWVRKRWHDSDDLWKTMKKSNNSNYTDYIGKNIYTKPCKTYLIFNLESFRNGGRNVGHQRSHHHGTLQLRLHRCGRSRARTTPWRHRSTR